MSDQGSTAGLATQLQATEIRPSDRPKTLRDAIQDPKFVEQISIALPTTMTPERFVRICLTVLRENPTLEQCDPPSFLGAVLSAATVGLDFGPLGLAYLVPFSVKRNGQWAKACQLIIGYKGYRELAMRSGKMKSLVARPVYAGDEFDVWTDEEGDHLIHRPTRSDADRGDITDYYGLAVFTNGGSIVHRMSPDDILARAQRSQTFDKSFSPWKSDPIAMGQKTVIRDMAKWLPLTEEVAEVIAADENLAELQGGSVVVTHLKAEEKTVEERVIEERRAEIQRVMADLPEPEKSNIGKMLTERFGSLYELDADDLVKCAEAIAEAIRGDSPSASVAKQEAPSEAVSEATEADWLNCPADFLPEDIVDETKYLVKAWPVAKVREYAKDRLGISSGDADTLRELVVEHWTRHIMVGTQWALDLS